MADDRETRSSQTDREANPFVLFRQAVDAQVAAAVAILRDDEILKRMNHAFDRTMNPLRVQTERDEPDVNQQDIWHKIERAFDRTMNPMRISTEEEAGHLRNPTDPRSWSKEQIREAQVESGCPAVYTQSKLDTMMKRHDERCVDRQDDVPEAHMWTSDGWGPAWTFDFFDKSSYSPLRLEQDIPHASVNWRHAFEDLLLLDAVHDEPDALNLFGKRDPSLDRMSGQQWKHALLDSGLLHSRNIWRAPMHQFFKSDPFEIMQEVMTKLHSTAITSQHESSPKTELEFYESMAKQESDTQQPGATKQPEAIAKPDIISQVTTIQQRILEDGTTSYKKTLKRRFSDGSEETETEEQNDKSPHQAVSPLARDEGHGPKSSAKASNGSWLSFWQS